MNWMRKMMYRLLLAVMCLAGPMHAAAAEPVESKEDLFTAIDGRALTMGVFRLSLNVLPDGNLTGTAMGWDITGTWSWKDGLFCREMDWSGYEIAYDCQSVEKVGEKLRFTAEYGKGRSADFNLR
jgi:hypothetical protein